MFLHGAALPWIIGRVAPLSLVVLITSVLGAAVPPKLSQLSRQYHESGIKADRAKLLQYAKDAPSEEARALSHFAAGMGDYEAGAYRPAAEQFKLAGDEAAALVDYARYYRARSLSGADDHSEAARLLRDYAERFPKSRLRSHAARLRVESSIRAGDIQDAQKLLRESEAILSPAVRFFLLARTEVLTNRFPEAVETYRRVYYKYPLSDQAAPAETALNSLRRKMGKRYPKARASWRLERADVLFKARKYAKANAEYRRASSGLRGSLRDHARMRIGTSDYHRRRTTNAYLWLSRLKVQDAEANAARLYYLAQCARRKKRTKEFVQRVEELGRKHPESGWYEEGLFSLGDFYLLRNDGRESRKYYERAARSFPKGKYASKAHWKVCWRAYLDKDPRARSLFEEHIQTYPRSPNVAAAAYWMGRLAEKNKEAPKARAVYSELISIFPNYYYAIRAQERLAKLKGGGASSGSWLKGVPPPRAIRQQASAETSRLLERGDLLSQLGLPDLAEKELTSGDYRQADSYLVGLALSQQKAEQGEHHRGLRYMKLYGYGYLRQPLDSMPRPYWEGLFPLPFAQQLRAYAAPHRLDPYLVAGLIRQESEFNPGAHSRAGARGLMQILPRTGRMLARHVGLKGFSTKRLYTPDVSLRLGTLHFRRVVDQFNGRLEYALAAYNAGEHRAEEWLTWEKFDNPEMFVETIPFTETRGYVQAVLRNTAVYRKLYGEDLSVLPTPSRASLRSRDKARKR